MTTEMFGQATKAVTESISRLTCSSKRDCVSTNVSQAIGKSTRYQFQSNKVTGVGHTASYPSEGYGSKPESRTSIYGGAVAPVEHGSKGKWSSWKVEDRDCSSSS
jgi:hypothetical protein